MRRTALLAAACAALAAGCGGSAKDSGPKPASTPAPTPASTAAPSRDAVVDALGGGKFNPAAIYRREGPGVVTVISIFGDSTLGGILGGGGGGASGLGSGFVINRDGEIVTNAHVVTQESGGDLLEARRVYASFPDGNRVRAEIRGYDPNSDVALLKVDPDGLHLQPVPLGSDADVAVGEPVAAIGSPFGEDQSVSVGIVSAINRSVDSLNRDFQIAGAVQTDAAINPGNSGGPLVDAGGRVIGINQQIQTRSGGNEGVGFAVPIDLVKRAVRQLREHGRAHYAYLGVSTTEVYPQLAEHFDLPVQHGAWVQDVPSGGPAADAGLHAGSGGEEGFQAQHYTPGGDVIVSIAGRPVDDPEDIAAAIALLDPGQTVDVVVHRGDDTRTLKVKLGERPLAVDASTGG